MASIDKRGGKKNRGGRYRISYFDEFGRRQDVTAGTSDYDAAKQIADKLETDAAMRRRGVITPHEDKVGRLKSTPLAEQVTSYIDHCKRQKQDDVHVGNKESQLTLLLASTGATVISELSRETVQRHLDGLADAGKSARTVNQVAPRRSSSDPSSSLGCAGPQPPTIRTPDRQGVSDHPKGEDVPP